MEPGANTIRYSKYYNIDIINNLYCSNFGGVKYAVT